MTHDFLENILLFVFDIKYYKKFKRLQKLRNGDRQLSSIVTLVKFVEVCFK